MQKETPSASAITDTLPPASHPHLHLTGHLFHHEPRQHQPRNVNDMHAQERQGINDAIAVWLTRYVGTMWMAYAFAVLAIITIFAVLGIFGVVSPLIAAVGAAVSQTFIQLVLLPVIMVGQNVLSRHSELQADEMFRTTQSVYHDIEQVMQHLSAQDAELLRHTRMLAHLLEQNGISPQQLEAEGTTTSRLIEAVAQSQPTVTAPPAPGEGQQ